MLAPAPLLTASGRAPTAPSAAPTHLDVVDVSAGQQAALGLDGGNDHLPLAVLGGALARARIQRRAHRGLQRAGRQARAASAAAGKGGGRSDCWLVGACLSCPPPPLPAAAAAAAAAANHRASPAPTHPCTHPCTHAPTHPCTHAPDGPVQCRRDQAVLQGVRGERLVPGGREEVGAKGPACEASTCARAAPPSRAGPTPLPGRSHRGRWRGVLRLTWRER